MSEFFAMGGYAAYVWPAYGATALVFAGLCAAIWKRRRALEKRLAQLDADKPEAGG